MQRLVIQYDLFTFDQQLKAQALRQPAQPQRIIDALGAPLRETIVVEREAIAVLPKADAIFKREHLAALARVSDQSGQPITLLLEAAVPAGCPETQDRADDDDPDDHDDHHELEQREAPRRTVPARLWC